MDLFDISKIKWTKSEEKGNFRGWWVLDLGLGPAKENPGCAPAVPRPPNPKHVAEPLLEEAKNRYEFNGTILDYLGLVQSLHIEWRNRQRKMKEANPIIHRNIHNIMSHKQGNKYIYKPWCVLSIRTFGTPGNQDGSWN